MMFALACAELALNVRSTLGFSLDRSCVHGNADCISATYHNLPIVWVSLIRIQLKCFTLSLSVCLSVCLSVWLSVCLAVCLCVSGVWLAARVSCSRSCRWWFLVRAVRLLGCILFGLTYHCVVAFCLLVA